jgi:hypothetical protein
MMHMIGNIKLGLIEDRVRGSVLRNPMLLGNLGLLCEESPDFWCNVYKSPTSLHTFPSLPCPPTPSYIP